MPTSRRKINAFTLIEILVVIGILGILIGLIIPSLTSAQMKARDTKRKSDLKQLQKALELYRQDQAPGVSQYPGNGNFLVTKDYCWSAGGVGASCPAGNVYMMHIPADPDSPAGSTYPYSYNYFAATQSYNICACLENTADPEGVGANPGCASGCNPGRNYYMVAQP